mgnify:CR=1 FL=1
MEYKKKKELRIRSCLTGAIWLALAFSMLISALLFAFLNHFLDCPGKLPGLGWSFDFLNTFDSRTYYIIYQCKAP